MTMNGWIQIALFSAIIIALTAPAGRLHDEGVQRRTDLPVVHPAARSSG